MASNNIDNIIGPMVTSYLVPRPSRLLPCLRVRSGLPGHPFHPCAAPPSQPASTCDTRGFCSCGSGHLPLRCNCRPPRDGGVIDEQFIMAWFGCFDAPRAAWAREALKVLLVLVRCMRKAI